MKRVLIVNAVPVNTGDAALLTALYYALKNRGLEVTVATNFLHKVKHLYPNIVFVKDVLEYPIIKKCHLFKCFLIPIFLLMQSDYRKADIVVGAPGGYINSFYGVFNRLYLLWVCKLLGKKVAIYSQSIGPLNLKDAKTFSYFAKRLDLIYARDNDSYNTVSALLGGRVLVKKTEDAAFLLPPEFTEGFMKKRVAVSVRDWKYEDRDLDRYYFLIAKLVKLAVSYGYAVEFLSTCQGVDGYIDDSVVADKIVATYLNGIANITINRDWHGPNQLKTLLCDFEFVIGTRLHICILSMLNGVPAFNISYETKGTECYAYLGIPELSVDYNAECDVATELFAEFVKNVGHWKSYLANRITVSHHRAIIFFEEFCEILEI